MELLIVIVVIAILAAISIVAYNSVSQKANNAAIIDAAGKAQRMLQAYIAMEGRYPSLGPGTMHSCITSETGCISPSTGVIVPAHAGFEAAMSSIGQLPRSVPRTSEDRYGVSVTYWGAATEGPVYVNYFLQGSNQQCGLSGVLSSNMNGYATGGFTSGSVGGSGVTYCAIKVHGPVHSA